MVICGTGFVFYLSLVIVGTYASSEQPGHTCFLNLVEKAPNQFLPCRDFGQEGHVLYFRQSGCIRFFLLRNNQELFNTVVQNNYEKINSRVPQYTILIESILI